MACSHSDRIVSITMLKGRHMRQGSSRPKSTIEERGMECIVWLGLLVPLKQLSTVCSFEYLKKETGEVAAYVLQYQ